MERSSVEAVRAIAGQMLKNATFSGTDHAARVGQIAEDIGRAEGADLSVLRVAALLPDIGVPLDKGRHFEIGALLARGILAQLGYAPDDVERIAHVIEAHSRYGGPEPETLEARILQDADAVEYVGAVGLGRAIVRGLESGEYDGDLGKLPALIDGLAAKVEGTLHTERGRALGADRIAYLRSFEQRLEAQLAGRK